MNMESASKDKRPGLLWSVFTNKCPRCRRGKLYKWSNPYNLKNFMKMNERCPVCSQPIDMEVGFYYGTNMVSYALSVIICVVTFALWWMLIGFSFHDNRFFWWILTNGILLVLLQPPIMRLSRTVWLTFFVPYSPNWTKGDIIEPERINKDKMQNC
jgi:uncharacterized protein (DUF983 family)